MKVKFILKKTGRIAGRVFSPSFWRRSAIRRARRDTVNLRLPHDGLLTGDVLREMLKHGDEDGKENERKTDQV